MYARGIEQKIASICLYVVGMSVPYYLPNDYSLSMNRLVSLLTEEILVILRGMNLK